MIFLNQNGPNGTSPKIDLFLTEFCNNKETMNKKSFLILKKDYGLFEIG